MVRAPSLTSRSDWPAI